MALARETSADIAALTSCRFERVQSTFLKVVLPIRYIICIVFECCATIRTAEKSRCDHATRPFENSLTQHTHIYVRVYVHASDVFNMTACIDRF